MKRKKLLTCLVALPITVGTVSVQADEKKPAATTIPAGELTNMMMLGFHQHMYIPPNKPCSMAVAKHRGEDKPARRTKTFFFDKQGMLTKVTKRYGSDNDLEALEMVKRDGAVYAEFIKKDKSRRAERKFVVKGNTLLISEPEEDYERERKVYESTGTYDMQRLNKDGSVRRNEKVKYDKNGYLTKVKVVSGGKTRDDTLLVWKGPKANDKRTLMLVSERYSGEVQYSGFDAHGNPTKLRIVTKRKSGKRERVRIAKFSYDYCTK